MHMGTRTLFLFIALAALVPSKASAQYVAAPNGLAIGANVGAVSFSDSISDYNFGGVGEAALRYTYNGLQVAGGFDYAIVEVDNLSKNRKVWGFFIDPRLLLKTTAGTAPYIGARVAWSKWTVDVSELTLPGVTDAEAAGWTFAGEFGVLIPLGAQWALDTMLTFGVGTFGDIELNDGTTIPNSDDSGTTGSLRVGIAYSFTPY